MYFESSVNKTNYRVIVEEDLKNWRLKVQKILKDDTERQWDEHIIPKKDFHTAADGNISLLFNNKSYLVDVVDREDHIEVYTRGSYRNVVIANEDIILRNGLMGLGGLGQVKNLKAGMPGKIVKIFIQEGQEVKTGEPLLIMEAMKMENEIRATADVKIKTIHVSEGDSVETGGALISFG